MNMPASKSEISTRPRILMAHNFYGAGVPSGEDIVYEDEVDLLLKNDFSVIEYKKQNKPGSLSNLLSGAVSAVWSYSSYRELRALLRSNSVDIAHFHNIFPFISPAAYAACRDEGVPVIQTLHNFRLFCANGMLQDSEGICESCLTTKKYHQALKKSCYRNSRLATIPVVAMQYIHRNNWIKYVDRFIALTEFCRQRFISGGLPADKISVKPNFVRSGSITSITNKGYAIFIGRLKKEKGIDILLDAWEKDPGIPLRIVGDGPDREKVNHMTNTHSSEILFEGQCDFNTTMKWVSGAEFVVMTSTWYETFGRTIIEAYCHGKAVIVPRLGSMAELVIDGQTGLHFEPGNPTDLAEKVRYLVKNPAIAQQMGERAKQLYEEQFTADNNFNLLISIYNSVLRQKGRDELACQMKPIYSAIG